MKLRVITWGLAVLIGVTAGVQAHPGGHGPVSDERALQLASLVASDLSERDAGLGFGKLDATWAELPEDAKKIHIKKESYLIVSLFHEKEDRTLYVLMSTAGEAFDANFSGDFPGLEDPPEVDAEE